MQGEAVKTEAKLDYTVIPFRYVNVFEEQGEWAVKEGFT